MCRSTAYGVVEADGTPGYHSIRIGLRAAGQRRRPPRAVRRRLGFARLAVVVMCGPGWPRRGESRGGAGPGAGVYRAGLATSIHWRSCGVRLECARVRVPLDWAHPAGRRRRWRHAPKIGIVRAVHAFAKQESPSPCSIVATVE